MNKVIKKLSIEECPKCKGIMERRSHREITEKMLTHDYFFSEWDFCKKCKHVQHYEKFKFKTATLKAAKSLFK